jgi:tetratricopeptide (TPR) repeat protein
MDANYAQGTARLFRTMLALAVACPAAADDATVLANDDPSTLVVTASDANPGPQQPPAQDRTQLVVHTSDGAAPTATAGQNNSSSQATLSVVANSQRQAPLAAIVFDPEVTPAGHAQRSGRAMGRSWGQTMSRGPLRPDASAGVQTRQSRAPAATRPAARASAAPAKKPAARAAAAATGQQSATGQPNEPKYSAAQLLIQAYKLSLTASSESEYSQIVRWCAEAMRHGLQGENRKFALNLSAWALNRRGQARADQGQDDLAVSDFRAALEFDPSCWRALHNRSVTFAQNGRFAEAFDDVCKVIEINPLFAKAYSNRATLYVQAGDFEKALADYAKAIELAPTLVQALVGQGRVCHLAGRLEEALASFHAAVEQAPDNAEIVCSRGDLLVDLGRYSEALEDYARAIDLDPKFEHAYRNGAWLLATCPDDAVRDAAGALQGAQAALDCGYGERHAALDTLAAALANDGRFDEAIGTMQQAIEIAPDDMVPEYQARQQLYESGEPFRTHPVDAVQEAEFIEG